MKFFGALKTTIFLFMALIQQVDVNPVDRDVSADANKVEAIQVIKDFVA